MSSMRHVVPAPLPPFVAPAHGYSTPANPTGLHRGLPSRHLTLVVELAAPLRVSGPGDPVTAHAVIGGLHTQAALIDATRPQEGLQYALTLPAATVLLGLPAVDLAGRPVDLADVVGPAADRLVDDLATATGWAQRSARLDDALVERLSCAAPPVPSDVRKAWRLVHRSIGRCRIAAASRTSPPTSAGAGDT